MAHLWTLDDSNEWRARPLVNATPEVIAGGVTLLRRSREATDVWTLVSASAALRLNGAPVPLGLAVLEDRDEIRLPGVTAWFSTETLAQVEPFPESVARGVCPRCKQTIATGSPAVRCPSCGLWHHESEEFPCWTYADTCAGCGHATALDAGFRWTPEDL
jgi:hypothetical protein